MIRVFMSRAVERSLASPRPPALPCSSDRRPLVWGSGVGRTYRQAVLERDRQERERLSGGFTADSDQVLDSMADALADLIADQLAIQYMKSTGALA